MHASCPMCNDSLVQIDIGEMTLRSCSGCDSRWWTAADSPAGIDDVLRTVAAKDRARRRPVVHQS